MYRWRSYDRWVWISPCLISQSTMIQMYAGNESVIHHGLCCLDPSFICRVTNTVGGWSVSQNAQQLNACEFWRSCMECLWHCLHQNQTLFVLWKNKTWLCYAACQQIDLCYRSIKIGLPLNQAHLILLHVCLLCTAVSNSWYGVLLLVLAGAISCTAVVESCLDCYLRNANDG